MKQQQFDYKPLTRDEMWRAREIALLEEIRDLLKGKTEPEQTITVDEPKKTARKPAVKKVK